MAPGFYEYMVKSPASQVLFDNSLKFYHSTYFQYIHIFYKHINLMLQGMHLKRKKNRDFLYHRGEMAATNQKEPERIVPSLPVSKSLGDELDPKNPIWKP